LTAEEINAAILFQNSTHLLPTALAIRKQIVSKKKIAGVNCVIYFVSLHPTGMKVYPL
jgi:uncharacterized membrane protein